MKGGEDAGTVNRNPAKCFFLHSMKEKSETSHEEKVVSVHVSARENTRSQRKTTTLDSIQPV